MKVFISWSGPVSRQIAKVIYDWLPIALQSVKPWFSDEIEKGANWQAQLFAELEDTKFSIVALTPDALKSDWIMFETGAAAKVVGKSHACPVLFGLEPTQVSGPLASFQLTHFEKDDFFKLFRTLNNAQGDGKLDDGKLAQVFEKWWPDLKSKIDNILSTAVSPQKQRRDTNEMVEETLLLVRSIQNALSPSPTRSELRALQNYRNLIAHNRAVQESDNTSFARPLAAEFLRLWANAFKDDGTGSPEEKPKKSDENS